MRIRNLNWFLMTLPAAIWFIVFKYITMFGVGIAFLDYKPRRGVFGSEFIGLGNFRFLFSTDAALRATRNTVLLNMMFIFVGLIVALTLAYFIYQIYSSRVTRYYQTALLLPNFISWVIVSYFVFAILSTENGILNSVLERAGGETQNWYATPEVWPGVLLLSFIWNSMGWSSLIYLAAMLAIDPQLYEAAYIDGAGRSNQFFQITLPLILPIITINLLLQLGKIFAADFGLFFQIPRNQPALYPTTDVLDTFIYRALTQLGNVGMASAAQFYQSVVGFVLVLTVNGVVKRLGRGDRDLSLF